MRHGGRIPYLYHFSKGRTHGTAVQRSYGRKEYEKGHHTGRGKGRRGFAVHGVPCAQQQWLRGRRRPPPRGRSHGSAALFAKRYSMQYLPSVIDFSEAAAKLLIERVEAGNALPEPERRIFTTHMKPIFERKVTLPKPDAAPTETDEKEK